MCFKTSSGDSSLRPIDIGAPIPAPTFFNFDAHVAAALAENAASPTPELPPTPTAPDALDDLPPSAPADAPSAAPESPGQTSAAAYASASDAVASSSYDHTMTKKQFHSKQKRKKYRQRTAEARKALKAERNARAQLNLPNALISGAVSGSHGDGERPGCGQGGTSTVEPISTPLDFDALKGGAGLGFQAKNLTPTEDELNKRTVQDFIDMGFKYVEWEGR